MSPGDRERIAAALQDENKPFRAIGRELGVSDWLVRKVARELGDDPRMRRPRRDVSDQPTEEVSALTAWLTFGGLVAFIALAIWAGVRWMPPPEA